MKNSDETIMSCFGMLISTAISIVIGTLIGGWALSTVWNWFMPSIFGVISLTLWQAVGLQLVLYLFTGTYKIESKSKDNSGKSFTEILFTGLLESLFTYLIYVGIAWIVLQLAF